MLVNMIPFSTDTILVSQANTFSQPQIISLNSASAGLTVNQAGAGLLLDLQTSSAGKFQVSNTGQTRILMYAIGVTPTTGLWLDNETDAAAGAQQQSPSLVKTGAGWKTDATAASVLVHEQEYVLPVQGAAAPTFVHHWQAKIGAGAYGDIMTLTSGGVLTVASIAAHQLTGNLALNGNYVSGDGGNEGLYVDANGRVAINGNDTFNLDLYIAGKTSADANLFIDATSANQEAILTLQSRDAGTLQAIIKVSKTDGNLYLIPPSGKYPISLVGMEIGAASTNNLIDDASNGAGSTTLYIGNAAITVASDTRVKRNMADYAGDAVALLGGIHVKEFDYLPEYRPFGGNVYTGRYVGLTAQELHRVAPWAVNTQGGKDCPDCLNGKSCDKHRPWQVNHELLTGVLVRAVQQLSAEVKELRHGQEVD